MRIRSRDFSDLLRLFVVQVCLFLLCLFVCLVGSFTVLLKRNVQISGK